MAKEPFEIKVLTFINYYCLHDIFRVHISWQQFLQNIDTYLPDCNLNLLLSLESFTDFKQNTTPHNKNQVTHHNPYTSSNNCIIYTDPKLVNVGQCTANNCYADTTCKTA